MPKSEKRNKSQDSQALTVHYVEFHGDQVQTIRNSKTGEVFVPIKPICERFGLAWQPQLEKLKTHPTFASTVTMIVTVGEDGKNREMVCLNLKTIPAWLMTIHPHRIPDLGVREKVILYQRECADVLYRYFFHGQATNPRANGESTEIAAALSQVAGALRAMAHFVGHLKSRMDRLEQTTAEQPAKTAEATQTIAGVHVRTIQRRVEYLSRVQSMMNPVAYMPLKKYHFQYLTEMAGRRSYKKCLMSRYPELVAYIESELRKCDLLGLIEAYDKAKQGSLFGGQVA